MSEGKILDESNLKDCDPKIDVENNSNCKIDDEKFELSQDDENTEEYIVEQVVDKELDEEGYASYLVKWEGYQRNDNTWEPVQNLVGCNWAIRKYELCRASWLANKYANKATIKFLEQQRDLYYASIGHYRKDSLIPSNAPIGKTRNNKEKSEILLFPKWAMCGVSTKSKKEWRVIEILGMTEVEKERYFIVSLEDYDKRAFIRASLANKLFPKKVIDFYIKNFKWKKKKPVIDDGCSKRN